MIGFVVEDEALEAIAIEVSNKLGVRIKHENTRYMNGDRLNKATKYVHDLLSRECRKVIILKDEDGAPPDVEQRFTRMNFPFQSELVLATMEAESWFLADEEAIGDYLGVKVNPVSNPESISKPKEYLSRIFRNEKGRDYYESGRRDTFELARRMRPEVVENRCPSFRRLRQIIRE